MDRVTIKTKAKEKIKGNLWYLWKPQVIFGLIVCAVILIPVICLAVAQASDEVISIVMSPFCVLGGAIESVFLIGYAKYCLNFVRGKKEDWKEPFRFIGSHFVTAFLLTILIELIILGGFILLIIPGFIFAIGHLYYQEVYVDNENLRVMEVVKKSWALTNGHKAELFVLMLSFFGWYFLGALTFGILYIWLVPYVNVTMLLEYEELIGKPVKEEKVVKEVKVEKEEIKPEVKKEVKKAPAKPKKSAPKKSNKPKKK